MAIWLLQGRSGLDRRLSSGPVGLVQNARASTFLRYVRFCPLVETYEVTVPFTALVEGGQEKLLELSGWTELSEEGVREQEWKLL